MEKVVDILNYNEDRIQIKQNCLSPLNFRKQAVSNNFRSNNVGSRHLTGMVFIYLTLTPNNIVILSS